MSTVVKGRSPARSLAVSGRLLILGAVVMAGIGLGGRYLAWPILTTTLGPTLYVFQAHPDSETARFRSAVTGHSVAVAAGLFSLAVFGLWTHAATTAIGHSTLRQAGAAAVALGLTLAALHLTRSHHAPAGATTLLIATGIARPGKPLFGLLVGLAAVILIGPWLGRLMSVGPLAAGRSSPE